MTSKALMGIQSPFENKKDEKDKKGEDGRNAD
jgi:hypothetical protein